MLDPAPAAQAEVSTAATIPADWYEKALGRGSGHDHGNLSHHKDASTPNFQLLGHAALTTYDARGRLVGSWGCAEVGARDDGRVLALMNAFGRHAFVLADVTDPMRPFKVGEFVVDGVSGYDAALTRDGELGVLAFNALVRPPGLAATAPRISFEDACGRVTQIPLPEVAVHNGVILLDLDDPANPAFGDYWPMPGVNLHSVATADVDGLQYVVASAVNLVPAASYWEFLLALDTPAGGKLVPLSHFQQPAIAAPRLERVVVPTFNGHDDASIQRHPATGQVYAYLSAWDAGMITLDITVPAAPVMVANWAPPHGGSPVYVSDALYSGSCYPQALHDVFPLEGLRDGRHYLLAQQECPMATRAGQPGGQVFVIDNTDPLMPETVGAWNLPVDLAPWSVLYQASPHYLTVVGDTMFVSMYHAGLWAVDLSGDLAAPSSVGVFLPDNDPPLPLAVPRAPSSLQVSALPDGNLALFEARTGVYVLRFDATNPAPPAPPAFRLA